MSIKKEEESTDVTIKNVRLNSIFIQKGQGILVSLQGVREHGVV